MKDKDMVVSAGGTKVDCATLTGCDFQTPHICIETLRLFEVRCPNLYAAYRRNWELAHAAVSAIITIWLCTRAAGTTLTFVRKAGLSAMIIVIDTRASTLIGNYV